MLWDGISASEFIPRIGMSAGVFGKRNRCRRDMRTHAPNQKISNFQGGYLC